VPTRYVRRTNRAYWPALPPEQLTDDSLRKAVAEFTADLPLSVWAYDDNDAESFDLACLGIMAAAQSGDLEYVEILESDLAELGIQVEVSEGLTPIERAKALHRDLVIAEEQVLHLARRIATRCRVVPKRKKAELKRLASTSALNALVPPGSWLLR